MNLGVTTLDTGNSDLVCGSFRPLFTVTHRFVDILVTIKPLGFSLIEPPLHPLSRHLCVCPSP